MINPGENELLFREVNSDSSFMNQIISLADKNSATLGFLPFEAFYAHAAKGGLIACISRQENKCIGYALYTMGRGRVKLTHLCVDEQYRGQNIARALISEIKNRTKHLSGILVSCRRDYNLSHMWQSLGFCAVYERAGKKRGGSILTEWWMDYCNPNLLSLVQSQLVENKIPIVVDANIFFDLADEESRDDFSKDAVALLADWLSSEIEIFVANEINNEINRNQDPNKRSLLRSRLNGSFNILNCTSDDINRCCEEIRHLFPVKLSESDFSDMRQLATSICSEINVRFFVTKDKRLLEEVEEEILEKYQLKIISPLDLIINIDEIRREIKYQPVRLAGTSLSKKSIKSEEVETLISLFIDSSRGERKADFRAILRGYLSNPVENECYWIEEEPGRNTLITYLIGRENPNELVIPILRLKKKNSISLLCVQHLILDLIRLSTLENRSFTVVSDDFLDDDVKIFLREMHFYPTQRGWIKINQKGCHAGFDIAKNLASFSAKESGNLAYYLNSLSDALSMPESPPRLTIIAGIEQALFPVKIIDSQVPNFIVPIKAWWAKDLFDGELAEQVIWGADKILALRREVVYYKSRMASGGIKAPGRILWYVSRNPEFEKANVTLGAVRACSFIDEVLTGTPKNLYKKFKRLGVYEFKDLVEIAQGQSKDLMAIRFSNTELFKSPVELKYIKELAGEKFHLQCPRKIDAELFEAIYNAGVPS